MGLENLTSYWVYLLENVVFTTLAVPAFANARLINDQGEFVRISSLFLSRPLTDQLLPANMFIPNKVLQPILSELIDRG